LKFSSYIGSNLFPEVPVVTPSFPLEDVGGVGSKLFKNRPTRRAIFFPGILSLQMVQILLRVGKVKNLVI
jgi:hypothetical protein